MKTPLSSLAGLGLAVMLAAPAKSAPVTFDNTEALRGLQVTGDVTVDTQKNHGDATGGSLRLGPGGKVVWPLREQDGTGKVELWIYEDAAAPSAPKSPGAGAMWGLMQADGHMVAVGAIYAPYLNGAQTYAAANINPEKQKPWQKVQYLGGARAAGWHKWTFDFDSDKGLRLLCDDKDMKEFNWNQSKLNGFKSVVLFGDTTDAKQTLWVDDAEVTLGPVSKVATVWPPPAPTPPADLTVLPPQAPWNPTPYTQWKYGPSKSEDYFPIAVWLQDPKNASRYKAAGINLYIGQWEGPTEKQLAALKEAGMPVICEQNEVGLAHKDDPIIIAWMQPDEPDNAQVFKTFWNGDVEKIKSAWPEIEAFRNLGPNKPYEGYGPSIPPRWIIRDYEKAKAADPTRPMFLGLGWGITWSKHIGRGERTGHLEDYPEYLKGGDIAAFDIYPASIPDLSINNALWYVAQGVRRLREWGKDTKPVWVAIETGIIDKPPYGPTPQQTKAEIWMAIVHGARGINYFVHQFKPQFNEHALLDNPDMLAMVTAVNQQITRLARVLNSPTVADGVAVESTNPKTPVHAMVKQHGGDTYVFSVAMYSEDTKATFRVKGLIGNQPAEVLGENRTIPVTNGVFTDKFAGNDVHLYKIKQ